jgi:hypothetical protein
MISPLRPVAMNGWVSSVFEARTTADLAGSEAAPDQLFVGAAYGLNAQAQPVGERPVRW